MTLTIRQLGIQNYNKIYHAMCDFNRDWSPTGTEEIWCLQHNPVYTLGLGADETHILNTSEIPVIRTDRGGQVTYHGPGQLIVYLMLNLKSHSLSVKGYVHALEQALIDFLAGYNIQASRMQNAPGVYVGESKVAALGIRMKHECSYHGIALNVEMDLEPYNGINPCGYQDQKVIDLMELGLQLTIEEAFKGLLPHLLHHLNFPLDVTVQYSSKLDDRNRVAA